MRLVIQRVTKAQVSIQERICGSINQGLLLFLGIHQDDQPQSISWLINKVVNLRIFGDENGKMNMSIKDVQGEVLIVSQFTLYGNCLNGRRPDFIQAAPPAIAIPLYEQFVEQMRKELPRVETGEFGADMQISLINDGPVTFVLDSPKLS